MTTEITQIEDNTSEGGGVLDYIDTETILVRMASDDPMVRLEAKLDYVINVSANMADGMSNAMDSLQDSPIGRMLGNMLGVNSQ